MRLLVLGVLAGCAPAAVADAPPPPDIEPASRVERWLIATSGDVPPSCDEKLAHEGVGVEEDPLGIPFEIVFLNDMPTLRLRELSYTLDGRCVFSWGFDSGGEEPDQLNVMRTQLPSGDHEVAFVASYGPQLYTLTYQYRYKLRGAYTVNLDRALRLFVTSYEKGGITTPVESRPAVRFEIGDMTPPEVIYRSR